MSRHMLRNRTKAYIHRIKRNPVVAFQHNGTWALGVTGWVNTPALGSELLVDGALEAWTSATNLTNWTESIAGTSTVNQETSIVQAGSNALRLDIDASDSAAFVTQAITSVIGTWYLATAWVRSSALGKTARIDYSAGGAGGTTGPTRDPGTTYTQYPLVDRASSAGLTLRFVRGAAVSASLYFDTATLKALTLNTLFIVRTGNVASVRAILVSGAPAGVVAKLNSISAPTDGIFAYHNGINAVMLKLVSGTYTQLISTAATYAANALVELRNPTGDTWQIFYNGSQRGTNQTISDVSIISNTLAGGFSTYSGNSLTELSTS